jgi:hypothetical protein
VTGAGFYQGKHYSAYTETIRQLKSEGNGDALQGLLIELVNAAEAESRMQALPVAPAYYEEVAILY